MSQTETNADKLRFTGKSSTSNIVIVPQTIYTVPANFTTLSVNSSGLVTLAAVTHTGAVIPTVLAVTGLTASNLDATITSRMATYSQPTGFLAATFPTTVASTTNITAGTITTVTTLTNLPAVPTDWLTAAGVKADAVTKIQAGLSTYAGGDTSGTTTLLARLTATRSGYLDNLSAGAVALATQIPVEFTSGTFASSGVFATAALANAPTGGSAPTAVEIRQEMDANSTQFAAIDAKTTNWPAAPAATSDIPTASANADALLGRNVAGGTNGVRTVSEALYFLRNKWEIVAGTLNVYGTNDSAIAWSSAVTTAAGDPISSSDPS